MGTTSRGYPYPEATDLVIDGDDAIEALAQTVNADVANLDERLEWATAAAILPADSTQTIGVDSLVNFTGAQLLNGFFYDGSLHYTGPFRTFLIAVSVGISNGGGGDASSSVEVRHNGTTIMGSYHQADPIDLLAATHTITVPEFLTYGDTISVYATASPAGNLDVNTIRVFPIGAVLP